MVDVWRTAALMNNKSESGLAGLTLRDDLRSNLTNLS